MKESKIVIVSFIGLLLATGLILVGCESTDWAVVADSLNSANNSFANAYSSSSDTGMVYTIYNRSSVTVTVEDLNGWYDIPPNHYISARFGRGATIYDVYYSPSKLKVTQSGFSFTFTD